jgi:hypothetical protein
MFISSSTTFAVALFPSIATGNQLTLTFISWAMIALAADITAVLLFPSRTHVCRLEAQLYATTLAQFSVKSIFSVCHMTQYACILKPR